MFIHLAMKLQIMEVGEVIKIKGEIIVGDFNTLLLVINKKMKIKLARKNNKVTPQLSGSNWYL